MLIVRCDRCGEAIPFDRDSDCKGCRVSIRPGVNCGTLGSDFTECELCDACYAEVFGDVDVRKVAL